MSLKWKIFRVLNILQLVYALALFLMVSTALIKDGLPEDYPFLTLLIPTGFLIMACNNYINLYILKKYYPDKAIPGKLEKLNTVFFITGLLFNAMLIVIIIAGAVSEFNNPRNNAGLAGKILLVFFFLMFVHWAYVLFMQIKLCNVIKREHYRSLSNTIDLIGRS